MSETRLIEALKLHYKEIVKAYADRISKGQDKLNISDVAHLYLIGLSGIKSDNDFQIFLANALKNDQFRFSPKSEQALNLLIEQMKTENFGNKHPMVKLLENKRPIKATPQFTSTITFNTKQQMLHIKEELSKDPHLKSVIAQHSLNYALEHDPHHLFSVISSVEVPEELKEKLGEFRESCLNKHQQQQQMNSSVLFSL